MDTNQDEDKTRPTSIKTLKEMCNEIIEINASSIKVLDEINHGPVVEPETKETSVMVTTGDMEALLDLLRTLREQSTSIKTEINAIKGI